MPQSFAPEKNLFFHNFRVFPLKNRCIVFFAGKNTPTETKTLSSESVCFPKKVCWQQYTQEKGENDYEQQ